VRKLSDKSVKKTLDWPNHRVGSSPSDPIRFEEDGTSVLCPKCLGSGVLTDQFKKDPFKSGEYPCEYCGGTGSMDSKTAFEEGECTCDPNTPEEMCPSCTALAQSLGMADVYEKPEEIGPYDPKILEIINRIEGGEDYENAEEMAKDVQILIDSGVIEHLQGSYQRLAQSFIESGLCTPQTSMQEQNDPSQQLNPTTEQNVTPFSQGQYMPSGTETISPTQQQQPQQQKPQQQQSMKEEGGDIDDTTLEDVPEDCGPSCCDITDEGGCDCADCVRCLGDEPRYDMRDLDEELKDPRIGIDKEKGKDKEKSMSPEAQKIASTDEKSIEAKAKAMPKIEVDVSDKIAILGKSGSGKTNLIKVLISDVLKDYQFVLLDALGNFSEYEGKPNVEYHQITPTDEATVDDIIYSALERGNCMVVMDEIDRYKSKPGSMVNELVNLGRNYGVGGIFAARRTADVNKDILANSPFIFTFQHILPQDLDVLIDWFAQPEEVFRDLQEYEAILFKDGEQAWQGKVPEKPTTKPTAKPRQPKKPKGKDKDKDGKDSKDGSEKEPEPKEKEPKEPEEPEEPEAPPEEEPAEEPPEEKPPEEEKTEEKERVQWCAGCGGQFQTGRELHNHQKETGDSGTIEGTMEKGEERPFKCDQCPEAYKYEKDFLNHIVEKHS